MGCSATVFLTQFNVWLARNVFLFKRFEYGSVFRQLLPVSSDRVLDYGCNTGFLSHLIRDRFGCAVVGCDVKGVALDVARGMYPDVLFSHPVDLRGCFDKIVISHVLEHVEDPVGLLRHAASMLKKGGCIVVSVPQERVRGELTLSLIVYSILRGHPENTHLRKFSLDLLKQYLDAAGFKLGNYEYIRIIPPFVSKRYSWLFSMSLVVSAIKK